MRTLFSTPVLLLLSSLLCSLKAHANEYLVEQLEGPTVLSLNNSDRDQLLVSSLVQVVCEYTVCQQARAGAREFFGMGEQPTDTTGLRFNFESSLTHSAMTVEYRF